VPQAKVEPVLDRSPRLLGVRPRSSSGIQVVPRETWRFGESIR
jgi:hypothetical protein